MKFYFRFRQLIGFPVWGQLYCGCQGELWIFFQVIYYAPYWRSSSIKGIFRQRSSSVKGRLSKVIFCQRSFSVKGRLLSNVVFRQRSSSVIGHLPLKSKVDLHLRQSFIKSHLPSKVVLRMSSSYFGSFSFLGFSPECGIAKLSLSLFVSLCWST